VRAAQHALHTVAIARDERARLERLAGFMGGDRLAVVAAGIDRALGKVGQFWSPLSWSPL
jgi:hypothetical protein